MVSLIATLIHFYSIAYMAEDPRYSWFFTYLSLFCFSMLALLASDSLFLVFMTWELVGICSYLLIGFWYEEKTNVQAANKAFIVNRIGDFGFLIGLGVLWTSFGTFSISEINRELADPGLRDAHLRLTRPTATHGDPGGLVRLSSRDQVVEGAGPGTTIPLFVSYSALVVAGLGIFAGCMGKSAQFPLHVWLPDAMAGPTPVSALIHAATLGAAGVYLVGRFFPLFTHEVLLFIAYIGAISLVIGATVAVVQTDYKRLLAFSTVSQLGFMMLGLGVGGWSAGLFHLVTHAFFKSLLFLGAGNVFHAVHTFEMASLGGLRTRMPVTARMMLVATLASAGIPFFSGFYSKDAVLASVLQFAEFHPGHTILVVLPLLGSFLTAFYIFRMWFLIFDGEPRSEQIAVHAHEAPRVMTLPITILAIFALVVGYPWTILPLATPVVEAWIEAAEPLAAMRVSAGVRWTAIGFSVLISLAGTVAATLFYSRFKLFSTRSILSDLKPLRTFLFNGWFLDRLYRLVFVLPVLGVARGVGRFDHHGLDRLVNETARTTRGISKLGDAFDRYVVDGLARGIGWTLYGLGWLGRLIQTGQIRTYVTLLSVAMLGLFVAVYFWIR